MRPIAFRTVCVILLLLGHGTTSSARPHHGKLSHSSSQHVLRQMGDEKLLEIVQTANIAAEMLLRSQPEVDVVTVFRDEKDPRTPGVTLRMSTDWCLLSKDMERENCSVEVIGRNSCTIKCP